MAEFDLTALLVDFNGKSVGAEGGEYLTLAAVCVNVLMVNDPNKSEDGKAKLEKFLLAQKLHLSTAPIPLTVEEVVLLKKQLGTYGSPLVVGRLYTVLDV